MSVNLRRLRRDDGARVLAWRNRPEIAAHMYADHQIGEAEHAQWLDAALSQPDRRYWIIELDGAPVGVANLVRIDPAASRCELALYLAEAASRGRGVGAAVDYLLARHAFETLGLNKIWCEVLAGNAPGLQVHERFGFGREAHLRDHVQKAGVFRDVIGLGLLRRDWPAVEAAAKPWLEGRFGAGALSLEG